MEIGKIEQLTNESRPPRTMAYKFARQAQTITRLQADLAEAKQKLATAEKEVDRLQVWAQRAYNALFLAEQTADHTIINLLRKVLQDAPEGAKGGAQ